MQPLFESLEARSLFSVTPIAAPHSAHPMLTTTFAPLVALQKMIGTWKGAIVVKGIHTQPVVLVISKQTASGKMSGLLTTPRDKSIKVKFVGTINAKGGVTIALIGVHPGGPINGTGTGALKAPGKAITFAMKFTQSGHVFPGSLVLKRV
jgi:hypothetical protein